MKQRRRAREKKWRQRFYRIERAATILRLDRVAVRQAYDPAALMRVVKDDLMWSLDRWVRENSIGEVGEREIAQSDDFETGDLLFRATVRAKRPHWHPKFAR